MSGSAQGYLRITLRDDLETKCAATEPFNELHCFFTDLLHLRYSHGGQAIHVDLDIFGRQKREGVVGLAPCPPACQDGIPLHEDDLAGFRGFDLFRAKRDEFLCACCQAEGDIPGEE